MTALEMYIVQSPLNTRLYSVLSDCPVLAQNAFILKNRQEVVLREQTAGSEAEGESVMADLSLYLTNVSVSLGQTMETDKVSPCDTTLAAVRVCE